MTTLEQCLAKLSADEKLWMYETRVKVNMTEEQKLILAEKILAAPKQWAQRVYEERINKITLQDLEKQLWETRKFWMYKTSISEYMSEGDKKKIALQVLAAPKSWAERFSEEFDARQYPPGYEEEENEPT